MEWESRSRTVFEAGRGNGDLVYKACIKENPLISTIHEDLRGLVDSELVLRKS